MSQARCLGLTLSAVLCMADETAFKKTATAATMVLRSGLPGSGIGLAAEVLQACVGAALCSTCLVCGRGADLYCVKGLPLCFRTFIKRNDPAQHTAA